MKKIFSSALFLGLAFGAGSAIFAQDNNSQNQSPNAQQRMERKARAGKMRGDKHKGMSGLSQLNLTDAQKEQLKNLRQSNHVDKTSRDEIRQLIRAKRNGNLTAEQETRLNTLREQGKANAEKMHQQVLAILTPEQRQQLEQMRQSRGNRSSDGNRLENRRAGNRESRGGHFQGLNLTDAQKEQLRQLRTKNSNDAAFQELRQLKQAKRSGSLTAEQENRLKTLRQQAKANGEKRRDQILSILTPEQRQQLEQNKAQRKERRDKKSQNSTVNK